MRIPRDMISPTEPNVALTDMLHWQKTKENASRRGCLYVDRFNTNFLETIEERKLRNKDEKRNCKSRES